MLFNPFQGAYGLDIGDRAIKFIQLSHKYYRSDGCGYSLKHASTLFLPAGLITNGEIQKPEEIIKLIKNHLSKKNRSLAKIPWVVVCLPETKTYIQQIKIPLAQETEALSQTTILQAAPSYLPYDLDDIYLDWQEKRNENQNKKEKTVLLAAAPKKIIDPYIYLLNIAGLVPLAFEVEAAAITRAVINQKKDLSVQSRGILDLGATRSSLIIYDHGIIQFSLSLPISGQQMTERIQKAFNLEFVEAEKTKKECGLTANKCPAKLKKILEETLEELADKIFQAIQFYKLHFPDKNPLTGIRLCGGAANLPALENYLSAKLKIKIRKANPWVNLFPIGKEPLPLNESLSYTTAIGLAMRALEKPIKL